MYISSILASQMANLNLFVAFSPPNRLTLLFHLFVFSPIGLISEVTGKGPTDDGMTPKISSKPRHVIQQFIAVPQPPLFVHPAMNVTVEYVCIAKKTIGVDIVVIRGRRKTKTLLLARKTWPCSPSQERRTQRVALTVDSHHVYQPVYLNRYKFTSDKPELRVWMIGQSSIQINSAGIYKAAQIKNAYDCLLIPAHARPFRPGACVVWDVMVKRMRASINALYGICRKESETVLVLQHPAVSTGKHYGLITAFRPYDTPYLEKSRHQRLTDPRFTLTMWLYVETYCERQFCSLMHHHDRHSRLLTPAIFINKQGNIHIQISLEDGTSYANLTPFTLPKFEWILLIFTFQTTKWTMTVHYGPRLTSPHYATFTYVADVYDSIGQRKRLPLPYFNDTDGLFVLGGSSLFPAFRGIIGETKFFRRHVFTKRTLLNRDAFAVHRMLTSLQLRDMADKCEVFKSRLSFIKYQCELLRERRASQRVCSNRFLDYIPESKVAKKNRRRQCPIYRLSRAKKYIIATDFIKRTILQHEVLKLSALGDTLQGNATFLIDMGLKHTLEAIPLFRQASCLGSQDATYMLSVIHNNAVHTKFDSTKAYAYLLTAALNQHRLASLALAAKFHYSQDGYPYDFQHAYMYYKFVSDQAIVDKEQHKDTDVITETVRLTDDIIVQQQMDEDGDIFHWLRHQAKKGVTQAQQHAAKALYWGSQGVSRNLQKAAEFYKMSAESDDPASLFDYGVVLLRGHGVEKNIDLALEYLSKSAKRGHPAALTALGWYALHYSHNYTEAVQYFEKGVYGGHADAGANLAHMIINGLHPKYSQNNEQKIFELYHWSATRGQMDAAVMVAYYYMKGTERTPRNPYMAAEWARFIAEQNPTVGVTLRKAFKHFKAANYDRALFYYMLAADAGIEVASFNVALLCDNNLTDTIIPVFDASNYTQDGVQQHVERDCVWRQFNYTIHRDGRFVNSYSWIKMGDYYWYGCGAAKNATRAALYYGKGIEKGDPQALFNLAFMVEEGVAIPSDVWNMMRIPHRVYSDRYLLLNALYNRCIESTNSEAYIPCTMAQLKLHFMNTWKKYHIWLMISTTIGVVLAVALTVPHVYRYVISRRRAVNLV